MQRVKGMRKQFWTKQIMIRTVSAVLITGALVCVPVSAQAKSQTARKPADNGSTVCYQISDETGVVKRGLVIENGIPYVYDTEGNLIRGGIVEIDGKKYHVSVDGIAETGMWSVGDYDMYFDPETYAAVTGLKEIWGRMYLFDESGVMVERNREGGINGKKYWFDETGAVKCGWIQMEKLGAPGQWQMYYDPETYAAVTGLTVIDGIPYVFDENGVLVQNQTPVINGNKYYVDGNGAARTGWLRLTHWQMYFDPETYAAATGLTKIGGNAYLFDENGVEILKSRTEVVGGKKYWFQPDGSLLSGWCKLGVWTMYFDPETYEAAIGQVVIDGTEYLFDENGVLQGQRPA